MDEQFLIPQVKNSVFDDIVASAPGRILVAVVSLLLLTSVLLLMAGCGSKEVSFDTLESARLQAKDNGIWNAQKFRATDPRFSGWDIVSRGDSSQEPRCPQGDGWVSIDLFEPKTGGAASLKCSTVSVAIGCMTSSDFKNKPYAQDDGHCQPVTKVPFPLPKLVQ